MNHKTIDYLSVILQYGYIIHRNKHWKDFTLRLIQILPDRDNESKNKLNF